jgi:murein L,D-transpeptidase YcbB/YkuD
VNPKVFCFGLDVEGKKCEAGDFLRDQVASGADVRAALTKLEPAFPYYQRAKKALQSYRTLAREDDGELLPMLKKPIEPGNVYAGCPRLIRLLRRLGDLPPQIVIPPNSQVYEGAMVEAVKHFQMRHGLEPDGRLGKGTLAQLNTPLSRRARQLQFALERWRWIPDQFSRPPILVNIPEFRLRAFDDSFKTRLEMKVVVGGAYHRKTPVFTDSMTQVIFRPYWHVPLSIQRAELAPKIAKEPGYLAGNDFEVVTKAGKVVSRDSVPKEMLAEIRSGKLAIRQVPGAKNALGLIKFVFPNDYNVYMHGTPATLLFSRSRRDFSHGCIRVEKPEELAAWVLRDQPEWTMDRIREAEHGAQTLQVNLKQPIPVVIFYTTAVVQENGEVRFFEDIYGYDAALEELIEKGYPYSGWKPTIALRGQHPRE